MFDPTHPLLAKAADADVDTRQPCKGEETCACGPDCRCGDACACADGAPC